MRGIWTGPEIKARYPEARLRLIRAREDAGLTRLKLAERLGVSRWFIYQVEVGRRRARLEIMAKWAEILDIPLEFFLPPISRAPVENAAA